MSDNKKYYYLKLKDNFFESDEIKILEQMKNGYKYSNLLLKLYLKSLKFNGALRLNEYIPYNIEMISAIVGMDIDTVKVAFEIYKQLKLIEILEDGTIYMLQIQNYIGKSSTEGDRKREYRKKIENQKSLPMGQMSDERPPEIEIEKDINIDIEIEIEKENKKAKKKKTSALDEIINTYTSNQLLKETLQDFLKMRKAQKKVMTDRALKTLLNKLDTLATTDEEKIERLEESICNCWLTVYPKKDFSNKNYKQESLDAKANKNYENLKKIMKEQQEHYEENVAKYMADCEEVPF